MPLLGGAVQPQLQKEWRADRGLERLTLLVKINLFPYKLIYLGYF